MDYYFSCLIILQNDSLQSQQKTLISVCFDRLRPIDIFKTCFTKVHSVSDVINAWFFAKCPSLHDIFHLLYVESSFLPRLVSSNVIASSVQEAESADT